MARTWMLALAAAAALLAQAVPARADYSLQAGGSLTAGYSNNVLGVPTTTTNIAAGDAFTTVSPGLLFTQQTLRMVQIASYQFDARLYARRSEADSFSNRLSWQSLIALSPLSELGLGADVSNGRINGFSSVPNNPQIQDVPRGDTEFVTAGANQTFNHALSRAWRLEQSAALTAFKPVGNTTNLGSNYTADASFGLDHSWQYDSLSGFVRGSYVINRSDDGAGGGTVTRQQVLLGPSLRYLHDFNQVLSGELDGGVVGMASPSGAGSVLLQPTGGAILRYTTDKGAAALSYRRTVEPNLLIGQTTLSDVVELTGGLPIPKLDGWAVSGSIGYRYGRILDVTQGVLGGSSNQFLADAALGWRVRAGLTLSGRLQTVQQHRSYQIQNQVEDLNETQVMLLATFRYPSRRAAVIPTRNDARVDRSNERKIGVDRAGGGAAGGSGQ